MSDFRLQVTRVIRENLGNRITEDLAIGLATRVIQLHELALAREKAEKKEGEAEKGVENGN